MATSTNTSNSSIQTANGNKPVSQKPKFSVAISSEGYRKLINNTLGDPKRAEAFIAAITSAVAVNPALQECEASTILAGALLGESLKLAHSPQFGQYYLVPFKQKAKYDREGNLITPEMTKAVFVCGYKGMIQLALRSGQYADIDSVEIREGEYLGRDSFTGKPKFKFVDDDDLRDTLPVIGYMAYFEYLNGFRKTVYWTKEKMLKHADEYSPAFSASAYKKIQNGEISDKDMWKYSSFWYKNFDDMAKKTMLRQLLSKWGIMSTEMQQVVMKDTKVAEIGENGEIITSQEEPIDFTQPDLNDVTEQIDLDSIA